MRVRRGHDLRRTFITLAQEDGARRDVLQVITHAPDAADVMSLYTTYPWSTLCAEVAKLQIALPEQPEAHRVASSEATSPKSPTQPLGRTLAGTVPANASEAPMLAGEMRPMEPRSGAPVHAETNGAPRSFGEADVATRLLRFLQVFLHVETENLVISSRCPGLNRGPTVYETVALPLSYSGK
jgi:hypothetical protein